MKKLAVLFALLCVASSQAQNVSPLQGTGFTQWFDNSGSPLVGGALYFYAAGTDEERRAVTLYISNGMADCAPPESLD